jgi:AraC-like DNA-binding protein
MSPNGHEPVRSANTRIGHGGGFAPHRHDTHQLVWALEGEMLVSAVGECWMLPRPNALWIPAGVEHAVIVRGPTWLRSVYFEPQLRPVGWSTPTLISTAGFLGELLEFLVTAPAGGARHRAERLAVDLLRPVGATPLRVRMPLDERARSIADALQSDPSDPRSLEEWGRAVGASARTLARVFERQTGLGFAAWRTRLRIAHAARRVAAGEPVGRVAHDVGYSTPSGFVAAFRRVVGVTPRAFAASQAAAAELPEDPATARYVVPGGLLVRLTPGSPGAPRSTGS